MSLMWESKTLLHGIHAFVGGKGSPIVLLPGWPETAEAYEEVFPLLSQHYEVWVLDPPGLGESAPSTSGYDTKIISRILEETIRTVIPGSYHLVGHDIGNWISYAWAAQFPNRVKSLTVIDALIPGTGKGLSFPLPHETNMKLWQFSFNALPDLPEILTQGKERELFNWLFDNKAAHPTRINEKKRARYVECYSKPGAMSRGFEYYRAVAKSAQQNKLMAETKLHMPVLALGGQAAMGKNMAMAMQGLADNVSGDEIKSCGHYVMEEQPEDVARMLLDFFRSQG